MSLELAPARPISDLKTDLRRELGAVRLALSSAERAARSRLVCEKLEELPWLSEARAVALFWPLLRRGEVDLRPLDTALRRARKAIFYPFVDEIEQGPRFGFRRTESPASLMNRGHGFAEPDPLETEAERGDLDVVVVPALGVAPNGHRLGHGAGFYDTVLPAHRPPARAVAVAFGVQIVGAVPAEEHDQACDLVITDQHCFEPQRQRR
jgi:5-formyltetrahydrofolate cyclo-ligase